MIIYQETKVGFLNDMLTNDIENIIARKMKSKTGRMVSPQEVAIFRHSLSYLERVLNHDDIPDDCGILIEYHLPQSAKRVDIIITGSDGYKDYIVIVELKAWSQVNLTPLDGMVETVFKGGIKRTTHPSYQAWSYASMLEFYSSTIEEEGIGVQPCVYMHNLEDGNVINDTAYSYYTTKAPVFFKQDALNLREYLQKFIKCGDSSNILQRVENGKIQPNKEIAEVVCSLLKGNEEFLLIDEQKEVFEEAVNLALHSHEKNKNVLIVEGGPGTGKSVVALNILAAMLKHSRMAYYVTKTLTPRDVYLSKIKGDEDRARLEPLFLGSGSFMKSAANSIPTLIVDEAHRLTEKTGFLKMGDNQLREIINTATCSIFFIDEEQRVHIDDYANVQLIEKFANEAGAQVHKYKLTSQFRCNGSDGYLAWLDNLLQKQETANFAFDEATFNYEFKVMDSPAELYNIIAEKNKVNNKSRVVAGYCWDWKSKRNPNEYDITIPGFDFKMKWNFNDYGTAWAVDPNSINEVGCIHTIQGLDMEYVGVIIGKDMVVQDGQVLVDPSKRSKEDRTIFGYKKRMKDDEEATKQLLKTIIKNTYKTLMTRGMKGCFVYCEDEGLKAYMMERLALAQVV